MKSDEKQASADDLACVSAALLDACRRNAAGGALSSQREAGNLLRS